VHTSVREALVADLGSAERAALHRRLAQAHEAAGGAPATIAAHWGSGGTGLARAHAATSSARALVISTWSHRDPAVRLTSCGEAPTRPRPPDIPVTSPGRGAVSGHTSGDEPPPPARTAGGGRPRGDLPSGAACRCAGW
jgi:hypothetical protein